MNDNDEIRALVKICVEAELRKQRRQRLKWAGFIAVLIPVTLWAATKPFHFSAGQEVKASEMNANFDALYNEKKMALIFETDVSAATQSVIVSGLNGDADVEYQIIARIKTGTAGAYWVRVNGDTAGASYGQSYVQGSGAGPNASATTAAVGLALGAGNANDWALFNALLFAKTGAPRMLTATQLQKVANPLTTTMQSGVNTGVWIDQASNITQLEIYGDVAGSIAAGSHIEVWARR